MRGFRCVAESDGFGTAEEAWLLIRGYVRGRRVAAFLCPRAPSRSISFAPDAGRIKDKEKEFPISGTGVRNREPVGYSPFCEAVNVDCISTSGYFESADCNAAG